MSRNESLQNSQSQPGRWNLNKLFGRLDIRSKLAIAFVALSGLPLALVGWYAAEQHLQSLADTATQEQRRNLTAVRERVQALLGGIDGDLDLLAGFSPLADLVAAQSRVPAADDAVSTSPEQETAESAFRDFLTSKPHYYRLRLVAPNGVELARVTMTGAGARVTPPGQWKGTGFRYYRTLLDSVEGDALAFAPVELVAEAGAAPASHSAVETDEPDTNPPADLIAALSFVVAVPLGREGPEALLVADVYARSLFALIRPAEPRPGESVMLVGAEGEYLFHSSRTDDWNTLVANRRPRNLHEDLPVAVAERVLSGGSDVLVEGLDAVVSYAPLFAGPYSSLGDYVLVGVVPKEVVLAPVRDVRLFILTAGALTLLVAGVLALLAAHQFAAPIRTLTRSAMELARGNFDTPVEVKTNDEIEDLAQTFKWMAKEIQRDVTTRRKMEQQLRQYAEHLETMVDERTRELRRSQARLIEQEKMIAVGQLAAGVAHELGTPLATILCHAQMAQEELEAPGAARGSKPESSPESADEVIESLDHVVSQANRCSDIVRNLLDFARPPGRDRRPLSVNELVAHVVQLMRPDFRRRSVEIEVRLNSVDPEVVGNQNELEQVLVNLMRNAADAMPEGGKVEIRVDTEQARSTGRESGVASDRALPPTATIAVRDSGSGIDEKTRARIFEPFFTTKAPGVGTGLGLWIVYNTVTDHDGDIAVDSAPGEGTEIRVRLPLIQTRE